MKRTFPLMAAIAVAIPLTLASAPAHAAEPPPPEVIAGGYVAPLKLALDLDGSVYVSDNFASRIDKIARNGTVSTVYTSATPGNDVGGVSAFLGSVYFTETVAGADGFPIESYLKKIDRKGKVTQLADIRGYENRKNPDQKNTYGAVGLTAECAALLPPQYSTEYTGLLDSHAYATLGTPIGTVVADAGSNALFTVDARGTVRTLAVFAPQPYVINDAAIAEGFPACSKGATYKFEPVPTDVELGPDGWLYVTLLPGGPESPALGGRGSVVKVNLLSGKVVPVASGFISATDLAVTPKGDIYVAELFGQQISLVKKGATTGTPYRSGPFPGAVEWSPSGLYATLGALPTGGPPAGQVVLYR